VRRGFLGCYPLIDGAERTQKHTNKKKKKLKGGSVELEWSEDTMAGEQEEPKFGEGG